MNILPVEIKAFKWIAAACATASSAANTRMSKLIVALAFLLIFQYFVGFIDFFEFRLIAARLVWMLLNRQLTESLFDFIFARAFTNAKHFIIISFCHSLSLL